MNRIEGSSAMARAMPARFLHAARQLAGKCPVNASSPTAPASCGDEIDRGSGNQCTPRAAAGRSPGASSIRTAHRTGNITPKRRRIRALRRFIGGDDVVAVDVDGPAIGSSSPIMCFISVLLPPPERRECRTSPRRTSKFTFSRIASRHSRHRGLPHADDHIFVVHGLLG